jgi:hypothetical protein
MPVEPFYEEAGYGHNKGERCLRCPSRKSDNHIMNESKSKLLNTGWLAMIIVAREAGNIMLADLEQAGLAFFIGRSWQRNFPPHEWRVGSIGQSVDVKVFRTTRTIFSSCIVGRMESWSGWVITAVVLGIVIPGGIKLVCRVVGYYGFDSCTSCLIARWRNE